MASDFPFVNRLPLSDDKTPDLTFTCNTVTRMNGAEKELPIYTKHHPTQNHEIWFQLFSGTSVDTLRFVGVADFYVSQEEIVCKLVNEAYYYQIEISLLGTVLSFWLERRNVPVLHASAVIVEQRAVAFLANNTGGKSSIAATLMQLGYPLLTDDLLPIKYDNNAFWGQSGYPQMRLWPDQAEYFLGHFEGLDRVHPLLSKRRVLVGPEGFGTFCSTAQPLACFYIPNRRNLKESGDAISITPVPPQEALIELLRYSFVPRLAAAVGMQQQRFAFFGQLLQQVPVRRISYPNGIGYLPRVRERLLQDIANL